MTVRELIEMCAEEGDPILLADGFDGGLVGLARTFEAGGIRYRAVYSVRRCVQILLDGGATWEEAIDHLEFNTLGAYAGPGTPSFLMDLEIDG